MFKFITKKLVVFTAVLVMVCGLMGCSSGEAAQSGLKSYKFESDGKTGEIILLDDSIYLYTFRALKSDGSGEITMELTVKGAYTLTDGVITLEKGYGGGNRYLYHENE